MLAALVSVFLLLGASHSDLVCMPVKNGCGISTHFKQEKVDDEHGAPYGEIPTDETDPEIFLRAASMLRRSRSFALTHVAFPRE